MDKTLLDFEPDEIRRRTRRSLLVTGAAAAIGAGLWKWLNSWSRIDGLNAPFRKVLDFNAAIAGGLFREEARAPEYERSKAVRSFRRNGDIGLADLKIEDWRAPVGRCWRRGFLLSVQQGRHLMDVRNQPAD